MELGFVFVFVIVVFGFGFEFVFGFGFEIVVFECVSAFVPYSSPPPETIVAHDIRDHNQEEYASEHAEKKDTQQAKSLAIDAVAAAIVAASASPFDQIQQRCVVIEILDAAVP